MNYQNKSFSVMMGNVSQDNWDRIFGKKKDPEEQPEPTTEESPLPDLSERQCAACLRRSGLQWLDSGLIECGYCMTRFPQVREEHLLVKGEDACTSCEGTGKLRTQFNAFACGKCGGTGSKAEALRREAEEAESERLRLEELERRKQEAAKANP